MTLEEKVQQVLGKLMMDTIVQSQSIEQLNEGIAKLKAEQATSKPKKEAEGNK